MKSQTVDSRSKVISMSVDVVNTQITLEKIQELNKKKRGAYICVSNVHMCMEVFDDKYFYNVVNNADLVIPDGRPIFWAQRLLGHKSAQQVRGEHIFHEICRKSNTSNLRIGLYGGTSKEILDLIVNKLKLLYPNIIISYTYSPPFRPLTEKEDKKVISDIESAGVDILFVGIGCPKQERWMSEHKEHVNCSMLGVGAAFDFIAGSKKPAPKFLQFIGMEWLFRLLCEPRRLWYRYLVHNPRFIFYLFQQILFNKKF